MGANDLMADCGVGCNDVDKIQGADIVAAAVEHVDNGSAQVLSACKAAVIHCCMTSVVVEGVLLSVCHASFLALQKLAHRHLMCRSLSDCL